MNTLGATVNVDSTMISGSRLRLQVQIAQGNVITGGVTFPKVLSRRRQPARL